MRRCSFRLGLGVLLAVAALTLLVHIADRHSWPETVRWALNIPSLSSSLRVTECGGPFIPTDIVITCAIEISPSDLKSVLAGYEFSVTPSQGKSHDQFLPKLGKNFDVAWEFKATPASFVNGGHVKLLVDGSHSNALLDLYIE